MASRDSMALSSAAITIPVTRQESVSLSLSPHDDSNKNKNNPKSTTNKKKLLVVNALGRVENLQYMDFAKQRHFRDWDCLAFLYVNETVIADDNHHLQQLKVGGCSIVRTPNVEWGVFLQYLPPLLVEPYDYVALLLDDMFLPDKGPQAVNIPRLLRHMQRHNVSSISPGIMGDAHGIMHPKTNKKKGTHKCLVQVKFIETFCQVFTRDAWACYYSLLHAAGGRGFCYDTCFSHVCPHVTLAVDYTQTAFHLERAGKNIPTAWLQGTGLWPYNATTTMHKAATIVNPKRTNKDASVYHVCRRHHCPAKVTIDPQRVMGTLQCRR